MQGDAGPGHAAGRRQGDDITLVSYGILINDVLDMSKIESGKATLNIQPFRMAEQIAQVDSVIRRLERAIPSPSIIICRAFLTFS